MKQNKIKVAVSSDAKHRATIMRRVLIDLGFARTQGDASKIIQPSVHTINLQHAYFVAADNFKWHESPLKVQLLYEMAARGILVLIGARSIPKQYEFICEPYYN